MTNRDFWQQVIAAFLGGMLTVAAVVAIYKWA
jgi:hypothetical protein